MAGAIDFARCNRPTEACKDASSTHWRARPARMDDHGPPPIVAALPRGQSQPEPTCYIMASFSAAITPCRACHHSATALPSPDLWSDDLPRCLTDAAGVLVTCPSSHAIMQRQAPRTYSTNHQRILPRGCVEMCHQHRPTFGQLWSTLAVRVGTTEIGSATQTALSTTRRTSSTPWPAMNKQDHCARRSKRVRTSSDLFGVATARSACDGSSDAPTDFGTIVGERRSGPAVLRP